MARKLLFARAKRELAATLGASPPAPRLAPTSASDDETLLDGHMVRVTAIDIGIFYQELME
jgi:hypothetical protein